MTTTETRDLTAELSAKADRYLWGHFARHGHGISAPIISRGEGCYIYDSHGKRYFDGLSGLFVVQVGHGRAELAEAAAGGEEHPVQIAWGVVRQPVGQFDRGWGGVGPQREEVQCFGLFGGGLGKLCAAVADLYDE